MQVQMIKLFNEENTVYSGIYFIVRIHLPDNIKVSKIDSLNLIDGNNTRYATFVKLSETKHFRIIMDFLTD